MNVYAATPEDVVIAKLLGSKPSESERQLNDAAGVVRMQADALDLSHVRTWVDTLDLGAQWQAVQEKAG